MKALAVNDLFRVSLDPRQGSRPALASVAFSAAGRSPLRQLSIVVGNYPLFHRFGVGQAQQELTVIFVGGVTDHLVLGCRIDVPEALLKRARIE